MTRLRHPLVLGLLLCLFGFGAGVGIARLTAGSASGGARAGLAQTATDVTTAAAQRAPVLVAAAPLPALGSAPQPRRPHRPPPVHPVTPTPLPPPPVVTQPVAPPPPPPPPPPAHHRPSTEPAKPLH